MNRHIRNITFLSLGHAVLDAYSSFLIPLLPLLALNLKLTPAQVGWLIPTMMITSSLFQPIYGVISDRYFKRACAVAGPILAAIFISSIGHAHSFPALLGLIIAGGIGIGAFHPQGAALAHRAAMDWNPARQGLVMSIFSSSGTVGYALGPLMASMCVVWFGLENSSYTIIFGILASAMLWMYCPELEPRVKDEDSPSLMELLKAARVPLTILYFAVVFRSAVSVSIQSYLPFWLQEHGLDLQNSSLVITGFIFFGGIGGFFGGALADRFGARRVSMIAVVLSTPILLGGFMTHGALSYLLIMFGGMCLNLPLPISVVMAQRLVPGGASTVSALVMGFAWGLGALMNPITGKLSEKFGLTNALIIAAIVPLISAFLFWCFPKDNLTARKKIEVSQEAFVSGD